MRSSISRRIFFAAGFYAFLLFQSGCSNDRPRYVEWEPIHWGAPSGGLQLGLSVQKYDAGGDSDVALPVDGGIYIRVFLHNASDHPLRIVEPIIVFEGMGSDPPLMQAVFESADDGSTHSMAFIGRNVWPYVGVWDLAPGEIRQVKGQGNSELWFAPWIWGVTELNGRCGVTYANETDHGTRVVTKPKLHREEVTGLWTGTIASGSADVKVSAPEPARRMDRHD